MKKAIVVSTERVKFAPILFSARLDEGFKLAGELGYDGVELGIRDTSVIDKAHIQKLAREYGLESPAIGTGQAFGEEGLSFSDPDDAVRDKAIARVKAHIDTAGEWGAILIIGLIRGRLPKDAEGFALGRERVLSALVEVADYARSGGVDLLLEPINRYETNLLNNLEQTVGFILETGADNIGVLADLFHMNIEEASIMGSIEKYGGYIRHVHMVDSNREAPGRGHLDIPRIIRILKSAGFDGYLSMEMLPAPDDAESARIAIENLRNFGA